MLENIEYLDKKSEFHVGDVKNLAVATNQKDDMAKMFPKNKDNVVSNADMLTQSFGVEQDKVSEPQKAETIPEPVQISSIPTTQNTNMEANPVDLSVNPINLNDINTTNQFGVSYNSVETSNNISEDINKPVIEPINPINENNNVFNSGFNVNNNGNIFDNPINNFSISQEEINKPIESNVEEVKSETNLMNNNVNDNIFSSSISKPTDNLETKEESLNDDIILAQIAIEESNVKHYEALAENSK